MECCVGTPEVHHRPLGQQQRDCLHGVLHVICWRARIQNQACQGSPATWWLTVAAWEEGVVKMTQGLTVSKGFFSFPAGPFCLFQGLGNQVGEQH